MLDLLHTLSLPADRLDARHSPPSRRIDSPRGSFHQEKVRQQERELGQSPTRNGMLYGHYKIHP